VKKLLKILAYSLGILLLLLVFIGLFTQTQFFRDRLRAAVISSLDSLLLAEVHLGNLDGNLVTGFTLDHISIRVHGSYLVVAERLDLRYDLFEIPGKTITVDNLKLIRPSVTLIRGLDGIWNFTRMIRPTPDDTATTPFEWSILINKLAIEDGNIMLVDSAALAETDHERSDPYFVEYHEFAVKSFNLETSVVIRRNEKRAAISSMSFVSPDSSILLRELSGDLLVTPQEVRARDLVIRTGNSALEINAEMKDVDLLAGVELSHLREAPVDVTIAAKQVDLNELKRFIHQLDFLNGSVALDLAVGGKFGELSIKKLELRTGSTELFATGTVSNLDDPGDLHLNVRFTDSRINPADPLRLLPAFSLPDFSPVGAARLDMEFIGRPLDFRTKFDLKTGAGGIQSDIAMAIGGSKRLTYKGELQTRDIDLAKFLNDANFASRLNGTATINGAGTSIDNLATSLTVEVDPSEFLGQQVGQSRVEIQAMERKVSGRIAAFIGPTLAALVCELDQRDVQKPSFKIEGDVASLNLAHFFRNASYTSDLTMQIRASGNGLGTGDMNGDVSVEFAPSRFGEYQITSGSVRGFLNQDDPANKELRLESNIADLSLTGSFDIEYLASLITYEIQNLRIALGEKFRMLDPSIVAGFDRVAFSELRDKLGASQHHLDTKYSLRIKDLEPISIVTGNRRFNGTGTFAGSIKGDYRDLSLDGRLSLSDFFYGNVESGVLLQRLVADLTLHNLTPVSPLRHLEAHLALNASKILIGRTELDSVQVSTRYQQEYASYTARSAFNRDTRILLQGLANVTDEEVLFTLNQLQIVHRELAWESDGGASVAFSTQGIRVKDLVMRRDVQSIVCNASVSADDSLSASIAATDIGLDALRYVLVKEELDPRLQGFAGIADIHITAGGTLGNPTYNATLRARDVLFNLVPFGRVEGDFVYRERSLSIDGTIFSRADETTNLRPDLSIRGTLPVDLDLGEGPDRLTSNEIDLNVKSDGIRMEILDPLLPTFNQLTGILRGDLRLLGTADHPTYEGFIAIDSCSFLFVPNNISYTFEGRFQPDKDKIRVQEATVRNLRRDNSLGREGVVRISGDFVLDNFKPTNFDLNAAGQLLVVKETTRRSTLSVYGNLFVEIGQRGLHYAGTIDRSLLRGSILIRNSSLVFPPTQNAGGRQGSLLLPVVLVDDTTKVSDGDDQHAIAQYFVSGNGPEPSSREPIRSKSFLDGIRYDLDIETSGGDTEIRMIFNTTPTEELVANVEGRFSITGDGQHWVGTVTISRSHYFFYKKFDAEGSIRFTGEVLNPELNIEARYEGTRIADDSLSDRTEKVVVNLNITGTRYQPKLDMTITIDGTGYYAYNGLKSGDEQSDAISFIIAGTFPLTKSQKNDVASNIGATVGSSLVSGATSLLSGALTEFLSREAPFIRAVEFNYRTQAGGAEGPEIRVTSAVARGIWRIGGIINADPFANVSVLYSFGDIFNRPALRNFMFEVERKVEVGAIGQGSERNREVNSARLFYRFSF